MMYRVNADRTRWLCDQAQTIGFDLCGVAPVTGLAELENLPEWLNRDYAGEMNYLRDSRRADPRLVLEGARSLIVLAINYNSPHPYSTSVAPQKADEPPRGWISRYAWGDDYHDVIKTKLGLLVEAMRVGFNEPFEARAYVDTGPIIERVAAKYAGLGWLAKNTCLIDQQKGSWLFLGVIVTTLALDPTLPAGTAPPRDLCGSCTRCLDACPTNAFPAPYVLDARRCISYLTIELRGPIPEDLRSAMGNAIIGCDICQDVCPWNRKAAVTALPEFQPRSFTTPIPQREPPPGEAQNPTAESHSLLAPELIWLASLSLQEFSSIFRKSAAKRAKWRGIVRNACVALGNSRVSRDSAQYSQATALLERLADSDDSLIAEHARWALSRFNSVDRQTALP